MKTYRLQIIAFVLLAWLAGSGCQQIKDTPTHPLILISIDGFRWDYLDTYQPPYLTRLAREGVRAEALIPVFPTKTFPNHYSIVTGLYAEHHGVIANRMYDPIMDAYFSLGNRQAVQDGRWYGGEPIWVTVEKSGKVSATFFWPGSEAEIQGYRPTYWKTYDESIPNDARVQQVLEWLALPEEKRPVLITLYFSDVDHWGHRAGPDSPELARAVQQVDSAIGKLLDGLHGMGMDDQVNLIIVSDHGMTRTSPDRIIFLDDYIQMDHVEVLDWSPVLALRPRPGRVDSVYRALKGAHPHLTVYKKAEIPERFHYRSHIRIPAIIGLADEGWSITTRSYFERNRDRYQGGTHGYDNRLASMRGIFLARGPAFKSGVVVDDFLNIHLYELMAHLLNVPPVPNDGSLDSVRTFLR
ncbi:MAG: alkaline phosphatase family protein [Calditrichaeota bacterium]|nr:alkaline phosphatase family protein [Calditrichota bacterium]